MFKLRYIICALAVIMTASCCNTDCTSEVTADPAVRFNKDGRFRIVQFTDVHFTWEKQDEFQLAYDQCVDILNREKPDLVVFSGDVVTGGYCTFEAVRRVLSMFDDNDIPYVYLYGNHDLEREPAEWDLAEAVTAHKNCLNTVTDGHLDDVAVRVLSSDGSGTAAVLYCMDSGDYSVVPEYTGYSWLAHSQIDWYVDKSRYFSAQNANVPVPSYAFFHIPLCEYDEAFSENPLTGVSLEKNGDGVLNSGLLSAMEENADVHGVFCGHDHDNDFAGVKGGVALVFGRFSGDMTAYNHLPHGARVIELKEGDYGFRTWIRERDGGIADDYTHIVKDDYALRRATDVKGLVNGLRKTSDAGVSEIVDCPRLYTAIEGPATYTFEGYINVPESGLWCLRVSGREKLSVTIDDVTFPDVLSNRSSREINLEKGFHPVRIEVYSSKVALWSRLQWRRPGEDRLHEVPVENYFIEK